MTGSFINGWAVAVLPPQNIYRIQEEIINIKNKNFEKSASLSRLNLDQRLETTTTMITTTQKIKKGMIKKEVIFNGKYANTMKN